MPGSAHCPITAEGRILLSLYAFGIFGCVIAALATFFIKQETASEEAELAGLPMRPFFQTTPPRHTVPQLLPP